MRLYKISSLLLSLIFCLSCSTADEEMRPSQPVVPTPENHFERNDFLEELIRLAKFNSVNLKNIDWVVSRPLIYRAFEEKGKRAAIFEFLHALNDNHSFYQSRDLIVSAGEGCAEQSPEYTFDDLPPEIGYVQVLGTIASNDIRGFARAIQLQIARQNTPNKKGWIVDLSQNTGGNMYPMLGGVSPLLEEGLIGYFIDPDGEELAWQHDKGTISIDSIPIFTMAEDFELQNPEPKIAVVYGGTTGSSGEATLIAFLGDENVKTFGRPSCGVSTANQAFVLSDGGTMHMSVSIMADRNKRLYGGIISPDVEASSTEELIPAVVEWIMEE
ncbi:MAG: S41 family peptidase [Bacteroidota bacterium]